jgi:hypothetical protein
MMGTLFSSSHMILAFSCLVGRTQRDAVKDEENVFFKMVKV